MVVLDGDTPWEWNCEFSSKTNTTIHYNIYNYIGKKIKIKIRYIPAFVGFIPIWRSHISIYEARSREVAKSTIRHKIKLENFNHALLHLLNVADSSQCNLHYLFNFFKGRIIIAMWLIRTWYTQHGVLFTFYCWNLKELKFDD